MVFFEMLRLFVMVLVIIFFFWLRRVSRWFLCCVVSICFFMKLYVFV